MSPVFFLINSLAGGGAERVLTTLLRHSGDWCRRVEVHLVLIDDEPDAYPVPDGLVVHRLAAGPSLLSSQRAFARLARRHRPAAVLSFLTRANLVNVMTSELLGYRCVISERTFTSRHLGQGFSNRIARGLVRLLYPRADAVIAVADGVRTDLVETFRVDPAKVTTIPNPVDMAALRRLSEEPPGDLPPGPYLVGMGRLQPTKNFACLIRAFAASRFRGRLVIVGTGPDDEALKALSADLGLRDRVVFTGFLNNPFPLLARSAGYVLCSNTEGFPNALVEAMALGVPVLSTDCPSGPSEILNDQPHSTVTDLTEGKYGLLVPVGDPDRMARGLDLLTTPVREAEFRAKVVAGASRYSMEPTVERYWSVIAAGLPPTH
ncbi:glycosyltransferase [Chthonobacter rhizosphaerae]|uniref:glycosyltransferase n=1 Tax=Chthonobacter rhizosphaerae TaxID=2735553 RepID=UPI0015EF03FC|nr:glycosyltransferase [Chthonobacter rhizosphaerae]